MSMPAASSSPGAPVFDDRRMIEGGVRLLARSGRSDDAPDSDGSVLPRWDEAEPVEVSIAVNALAALMSAKLLGLPSCAGADGGGDRLCFRGERPGEARCVRYSSTGPLAWGEERWAF